MKLLSGAINIQVTRHQTRADLNTNEGIGSESSVEQFQNSYRYLTYFNKTQLGIKVVVVDRGSGHTLKYDLRCNFSFTSCDTYKNGM